MGLLGDRAEQLGKDVLEELEEIRDLLDDILLELRQQRGAV